jgi:hypothetical protein
LFIRIYFTGLTLLLHQLLSNRMAAVNRQGSGKERAGRNTPAVDGLDLMGFADTVGQQIVFESSLGDR